jgi:hypothetical protein
VRLLAVLAVTVALAWGVLRLLGNDEPAPQVPEDAPGRNAPVDAHTGRPLPAPRTGTLVVTVRSRAGRIPRGARGGYRVGGVDRLRPVNARGQALFTDAPLGELETVAQAPGFRPVRQKRFLTAGLRLDAMLVLEPEEKTSPPPSGH